MNQTSRPSRLQLQQRLTARLRALSKAIDQDQPIGPICKDIGQLRAQLDERWRSGARE